MEENASSFRHKEQTELSPASHHQEAENSMPPASKDMDDIGSDYGHESSDIISQASPYSALKDFLKTHLRQVR